MGRWLAVALCSQAANSPGVPPGALAVVGSDGHIPHVVAMAGVDLDGDAAVGVPQPHGAILRAAAGGCGGGIDQRQPNTVGPPRGSHPSRTLPHDMQYVPSTLKRTASTGPSWPLRQKASLLGSFSLGGSKEPGAGAGPSGRGGMPAPA